jgi:hypothetical protein
MTATVAAGGTAVAVETAVKKQGEAEEHNRMAAESTLILLIS